MPKRDCATNQLLEFKENQQKSEILTTRAGAPLGKRTAILTAGSRGPVLMQDVVFLDEMGHFDKERIPERVVHAKGAGAFGYFETTHDIHKYCKAVPFESVGKKTPVAARFSTVRGESGSADTARDPRGFALKFYTEMGNWDLVGNNTPIFFIRDPMLDADMFWDFITLRPETTHHVSFVFTDRGTPDGYRHMNGYGSHTYKMVNNKGEAVYCKFHFKTDQGIKCLTAEQAVKLAASNPDYAIQDLYNAIAMGNYPSWTLYIQVMSFKEAETLKWNPFDLSKVWPHGDYPLIPVGRLVLNRNPKNYFAEVEQIAFSPTNMIPGIEPSPDKMLQARLFAYTDTHVHRLGVNYLQFPVNCPFKARAHHYQRDGPQCVTDNQGDGPNYFPNSFSGPDDSKAYLESPFQVSGDVQRFDAADDDNFSQVEVFWSKVLSPTDRTHLVQNIADHLINAQEFIQKRAIHNFSQAHPDYGRRVQEELEKRKSPWLVSGHSANL